jgi:hypothetical protein
MRRAVRLVAAVPALVAAAATTSLAQSSVAIQTNVLFYGDNTEFRNPFREGETVFGTAVRVAAAAGLNDRTTLTLGVFANQRFGSDEGFDLVRPVITLTVKGRRSAFVFGALPASPYAAAIGPDRQGPHGLLPPLQRETRSIARTKPACSGCSPGPGCATTCGSTGSASTRPTTANASTPERTPACR